MLSDKCGLVSVSAAAQFSGDAKQAPLGECGDLVGLGLLKAGVDLPGKSREHHLRNREVLYGSRPMPEFRREAVRLALTSDRTRREVGDVGMLMLSGCHPGLARGIPHPACAIKPKYEQFGLSKR